MGRRTGLTLTEGGEEGDFILELKMTGKWVGRRTEFVLDKNDDGRTEGGREGLHVGMMTGGNS